MRREYILLLMAAVIAWAQMRPMPGQVGSTDRNGRVQIRLDAQDTANAVKSADDYEDDLIINDESSEETTTKAYSHLQNYLNSQKPLDCYEFDTDLIECFAYNLFLRNTQKFQDLDPENNLMKPVLTKQFTNKTIKIGQNVTLTCETQIDALPIFMFYKLDPNIIKAYQSANKLDNSLILDRYAKSLQNKDAVSYYESIDRRFILERRQHSQDSNKDPLSDLETINLNIVNTIKDDTGYYLCIVANSLKSFRVTYSFLNVTEASSEPSTDSDSIKDEILLVEKNLESFFSKHKNLLSLLYLLAFSFLVFVSLFVCYCCANLVYRRNLNDKLTKPGIKQLNEVTPNAKMNSFLEKTMNSMKKNFVYVTMSDNGSDSTPNSSTQATLNNATGVLALDNCFIESETKNSHLFMNKNDIGFLEEDPEWEFQRDKLKLGRLIDEGAFGRVYMADAFGIIPGRYKTTVAVKTLKENASQTELNNFIRELEIMKTVGKHENIISLLGCCTTKQGPLYAVVEYAKYGNLRNYLRSRRPKDYMLYTDHGSSEASDTDEQHTTSGNTTFSNLLKLYSSVNRSKVLKSKFESAPAGSNHQLLVPTTDSLESIELICELIKYCMQISNGMKYLHSKKVCHRDLAARNILLDEHKVAKIADFGFARDLQQNYYYTRKSESPIPVKWMAPESLFDRKIYPNSDIWSFGVLMWEVFTLGGNPYPTVPIEKLFDYLKEGNRMSKPMYADDELYQLMMDCWQFKSDQRPSFLITGEKLDFMLRKYEAKKEQQSKLVEMEKLFDQHHQKVNLNPSGLSFSRRFVTGSGGVGGLLTINPTSTQTTDCLVSSVSSSTNASSILSRPSYQSQKSSNDQTKRMTRQSESEDSQYFSGADTSLVYLESSNFSTASSAYTNYSLPSTAAASKAVSIMAASLAQGPPSPPPPKPFANLLNVASAAYHL